MPFTVIRDVDNDETFVKISMKDMAGKMAMVGYMSACAVLGKKDERDKALEFLNKEGVFE